ncbi:MAG: hypothetical protein JMDDDDMK_03479 [Acidobacteria bacterium]|nr:hypothetical protein [Acidobacteriota bacterium]
MNFPFDPHGRLIYVQAQISGPSGVAFMTLALDTGATRTLISPEILIEVGYDLSQAAHHSQMTTGSQVERVPLLTLDKLAALGQERLSLMVACHSLPPSAGIDGLLGLDFFRGLNLNIDFCNGTITLQ